MWALAWQQLRESGEHPGGWVFGAASVGVPPEAPEVGFPERDSIRMRSVVVKGKGENCGVRGSQDGSHLLIRQEGIRLKERARKAKEIKDA